MIATAASATASGSSRSRLRNTSASTIAITSSAATSSRSSESVSAAARSSTTTGAPVTTYEPPFVSCHSFIATAPRTDSIARRRSASLRSGLSRTWMTAAFGLGNR